MEQETPMAGPPLSSCTPQQWSLASLAGPGFFPDSLSCGILTPSGCLHAVNHNPLPGVWPLKPKPQDPAPTCPGKQKSVSGWGVLVGTNPLCRILSALPSARLLLHSPLRLQNSPLSPPVRGLPSVWKLFFLHSSLPEIQVPSQFLCLFFFPFFFCPTQLCGDFLAFLEVWGLLPAFSRRSVAVDAHPPVDVFLMYLWGRRWSPCLTPLPSSPNSAFAFFLSLLFRVPGSLMIHQFSQWKLTSKLMLTSYKMLKTVFSFASFFQLQSEIPHL